MKQLLFVIKYKQILPYINRNSLFTKKVAFTLVEVMVVMAIIAVLSVLIIGAISIARRTAQNTKKVGDIKGIMAGLEAYKTKNKRYPTPVGIAACGGWEVGNQNNPGGFLTALNGVGLNPVPTDDTQSAQCNGYKYYRYAGGSYGCNGSAFYVLGITSMGGGDDGPGWSCSGRNWGNEFDWVTGAYE
jgi:prepilin-type N-terminal cleavage/methylation domain-containing protein